MIRVLIVDDSVVARSVLRAIFERAGDIEIVGEARDGHEAVMLANRLRPDLVTMDLEMPGLHGLEAIDQIVHTKAVPILVVSSVADARNACEALHRGALDVIAKPAGPEDVAELLAKVRLLAGTVVITRWSARRQAQPGGRADDLPARLSCLLRQTPSLSYPRFFAIAASTGGPQALAKILPCLPADFPAPIAIAQHIAAGFAGGMAAWLAGLCPLPVRVATAGELLCPGNVYISPSEHHLTVAADGRAVLQPRHAGDLYRPSGDALLGSVADSVGLRAVGIVLTGMGDDGARGLARIHDRGGVTLAQDEASSVIYGMNRVAIEAGVVDRVLPLEAIAAEMIRLAAVPARAEQRSG